MPSKLYVGGLPYRTTDDQLRELFAQVGEVTSASVILDRATGRSKGFGFVEMASEELAQAAIEQFNGKEYDGRTLTVNEARPLQDRPPRSSGSGGFSRGNDRGDDRRRSW